MKQKGLDGVCEECGNTGLAGEICSFCGNRIASIDEGLEHYENGDNTVVPHKKHVGHTDEYDDIEELDALEADVNGEELDELDDELSVEDLAEKEEEEENAPGHGIAKDDDADER